MIGGGLQASSQGGGAHQSRPTPAQAAQTAAEPKASLPLHDPSGGGVSILACARMECEIKGTGAATRIKTAPIACCDWNGCGGSKVSSRRSAGRTSSAALTPDPSPSAATTKS